MDQMFAEHIFHDNAIFGVLMGLGIAGMVVYILLSALFEEAREQGKRWRSAHGPLTDSHQSPGVRACAERLASKRRSARIEAARLMCDLNDTSAVPALLRAMDLHWKDADFLEVAVRSLAVLGDARALPTLRRLTHDRNMALMQAARDAIEAIEPRSALLRGANAPIADSDVLLRPATSAVKSSASNQLLRAVPGNTTQD